jgi:protein-S-isoprenylcysteine O-methyltransferase Ste14
VAIRFEGRDLMRERPEYRAYRRSVPMLIPRLARGESGSDGARIATSG